MTHNSEHLGLPLTEIERHTSVFMFDSVTVTLQSSDRDTIAFCNSYFHSYANYANAEGKDSWTITDTVDESVLTSTWNVDHGQKTIMIARSSSDARVVMRIIRSLMMYKDVADNKVLFKGAAFVNKNGKGIVLMGDEQAGKTSIILDYMLKRNSKARFVTNSHVSLGLKGEQPYAFGYPMAVGVRTTVLEAMKERGSAHVAPLLDDLNGSSAAGEDGRYYLDPKDLEKYFHRQIAGHTSADAIILVESIPAEQNSTLRLVSTAEVIEFFKEYFLKYHNHDAVGWYNILGVQAVDQRDLIANILSRCQIYVLSYSIGNPQETMRLINSI